LVGTHAVAAPFLRAFAGSRTRSFIAINAHAGSDSTVRMAQPMSNPTSRRPKHVASS